MLSGDLTDFPLRDLLRLLASTGKSGQLTLHGAGGAGAVFLRDGGICCALIDVTRVPLGPRLIRTGNADREAVATAARAADGTTFGLTCALLRGVHDAAAASAFVVDHTREAIGWLSQHFAATFEFDPSVAVDAWPFTPLAAEELLAAVEGDAQAWTDLRAVVGDLSLVPSCLPDPSDAALRLTSSQWRLVALIDGQRTTMELFELAGLGQLEAARELAGLVRDGLVELLHPGTTSAVDELLADVHMVDTFAISPAWMAQDDDVPARILGTRDGDVEGDPADSHMLETAEDLPAEPAPQATSMREPAPPERPHPARPAPGEAHHGDVPAESAPDANVGLLHRLVGRGRSS